MTSMLGHEEAGNVFGNDLLKSISIINLRIQNGR